MTYQRRCELPRSDVQNLDARVAGYAHKRVTIFSLGPNDAVVIELLVIGCTVFCGVLFVLEPPQNLDGAVLAQYAPAYDSLG